MANGDNPPGPDWLYDLARATNPFMWGGDGGGGGDTGVLSDDELYQLAVDNFGAELAPTMYAIAKAESGGNPRAHNADGEDSRGLWQINIDPRANPDLANYDLFDPVQNAQAARIVLSRQGPEAWSTFTNQSYVGHLPPGTQPPVGGGETGTDGEDPMQALIDLMSAQGGIQTPDAFSLDQLQDLGLDRNNAMSALLEQFGIRDGEVDRQATTMNAEAQRTNASANYMNAITSAATQRANQAYQEGQLAVSRGELGLAEQQFAASEYWTGVANDMSQRGFDLQAAESPANIATNMFNAQSSDRASRGALDLGAANTFSGLGTMLGDLSKYQMDTGISLLTNPRNATAAFLLGQGQDPNAAASMQQFNVERLLGINPQQIQDMVSKAAGAASAAQRRAAEPSTINLQTFLDALSETANRVQFGAGGEDTGGEGAPQLPSGWTQDDSGRYQGPNPFANGTPRRTSSTASAPPETNFQRRPTGTVTVSPTNRVAQRLPLDDWTAYPSRSNLPIDDWDYVGNPAQDAGPVSSALFRNVPVGQRLNETDANNLLRRLLR